MNDLFDFDEPITKPRLIWFSSIGFVWMLWIFILANEAYDKAKAELDKTGFLSRWWNGNVPRDAWIGMMFRGLLGLILVFAAAHLLASLQLYLAKSIAEWRSQREFKHRIRTIDIESFEQARLSKIALSKKELIMRLGSIDQFIRVLEHETDPARRTVALQAASSELTALSAKLATGEIVPEASDSPEVQQAAKETSFDLAKVGLAEDRLNRDLRRMFKLSDAPLALPEQRA
jgi:hypothetical protein